MLIATETPHEIEPEDAAYIAAHLCRPGSEFQAEMLAATTATPMAVVYQHQPVAWACTHKWRGMQTLEAFTHPQFRRQGWCRVAALTLMAARHLNRHEPIAVFSPECVGLTRALGFAETRLFLRDQYGDWRESR